MPFGFEAFHNELFRRHNVILLPALICTFRVSDQNGGCFVSQSDCAIKDVKEAELHAG